MDTGSLNATAIYFVVDQWSVPDLCKDLTRFLQPFETQTLRKAYKHPIQELTTNCMLNPDWDAAIREQVPFLLSLVHQSVTPISHLGTFLFLHHRAAYHTCSPK